MFCVTLSLRGPQAKKRPVEAGTKIAHTITQKTGDIMRETYLDGLRGWAALFVVFGHLGPVFLLVDRTFPPLPFFIDARLAVFVFFVLSGYVLSIGFFQTGVRVGVVSLALRRYLRLTIPIAASVLLAVLVARSGLAQNQAAGEAAGSPWLALGFSKPLDLLEAAQFALFNVYSFTPHDGIYYNAVLWTMPFELVGSFLIFACLLIAGASRPSQALIVGAFCIAAWWANSYFLPFALGMAVALSRATVFRGSLRVVAAITLGSVLTVSALRYPGDGIRVLSIFSALILAACILSPAARRFLDLPISQWLGRLSFPLYLTHLFSIYTVGSWLYLLLGDGGEVSPMGAIAVAAASTFTALVIAAALSPVETFSVSAGRAFSSFAIRLFTKPMRARV
ncbi:acyltransferase family protein [Achromobacter mucicolens]|uniref:acyltransferase family protein n=1 Tax=Achromobacter mucicolens TaxID=1389922 RepID=UPI0013032393|nr:acyltransferase [Achromobacter mucicolens]